MRVANVLPIFCQFAHFWICRQMPLLLVTTVNIGPVLTAHTQLLWSCNKCWYWQLSWNKMVTNRKPLGCEAQLLAWGCWWRETSKVVSITHHTHSHNKYRAAVVRCCGGCHTSVKKISLDISNCLLPHSWTFVWTQFQSLWLWKYYYEVSGAWRWHNGVIPTDWLHVTWSVHFLYFMSQFISVLNGTPCSMSIKV